jgi:hypothetical protein
MTERDLRIAIFSTSSYLTFSGEVGSVLTVSGGIARGAASWLIWKRRQPD